MKFLTTKPPMFATTTPTPAPKHAAKVDAEEDPVETAVDRMARLDPEKAAKKRFLRDETAKQVSTLRELHDTEHWFAVNAESRAQKEALLRALGLFDAGDKYLSALDVADIVARLLDAPAEERAAAAKALRALRTAAQPKFATPKQSRRLLALTRP